MTLRGGTRLGSYEIVRPLGAGGMGQVYRARETRLARDVAIKVLPAELARDSERLSRFEKEARAASALSHPNIITIYEIGHADGTSFIAMELVEGKTLREALEAGPLGLKKVLAVAAQLADGLAKAHAAGIVHRDLKPENLMLTRDGFVKILDFGLAKLVPGGFEGSRGTELATLTRGTEAGTILGTVGYMSPEQASGEPVDFRSDQFSFGAILYEMITGKRAFERRTSAQTLSAIIESEPQPLTVAPDTPTNLVWVVERCLAKDPDERYGSTKDLARDLAAIRDHRSGVSVSGVAPPSARRLRLARPVTVALAALVAAGLAALAFIAGQSLQAKRSREAPPPQRQALTYRRGFLTGARFAPDGQTIVYSAAWDGKPPELFTTRVGSTESRSLGIVSAGLLAVSSAGEMAISLGCENRFDLCVGTLARVPLAGGAPRELLDNVSSADWSPDGKDLAVVHRMADRDRLEYPIGKVLHEHERGFLGSVRVSPNGELVAFIERPRRDSTRGIVSVVDRSGKKKPLTDEWARLRPVLWSPTGEEVFFSQWGGRETRGARISGGTRRAPGILGLDDVSREGLFLDTGMLENLRRVILARVPDAPEERNLAWLLGSTSADLSPDGRQLLLYENITDPDQPGAEALTTYLRKTDGSDAKLLGEGRPLALSPDQTRALVRHPTEMRLVLLPTGAGEPRDLPGGNFLRLRWATFFPDGRRILFAADEQDGTARSYIQDVEGGPPKPLGDEGVRAVLVSPDGQRVAGTTTRGVHLIFRADGEGRPRPIGGALKDDALVQWSSDGKAIYVRGGEARPLILYRLDLATGRRERWKELVPPDLTGFQGYGNGPGAVCLTPDGRFYAYTFITDSSRLILSAGGRNWWK